MKIGDLVKVKNLTSSDYGIIIGTRHELYNVWFLALEYDMEFYDYELEVTNGRKS